MTFVVKRIGVACNWAVPNGTEAGSITKNCVRSL
jgi:hypothetical protein